MDCSVITSAKWRTRALHASHKAVDAVRLYVLLGVEAHLLLHLHLHPEALAVEAVLVALLEALHGLVPLEQVLVGAGPKRDARPLGCWPLWARL